MVWAAPSTPAGVPIVMALAGLEMSDAAETIAAAATATVITFRMDFLLGRPRGSGVREMAPELWIVASEIRRSDGQAIHPAFISWPKHGGWSPSPYRTRACPSSAQIVRRSGRPDLRGRGLG